MEYSCFSAPHWSHRYLNYTDETNVYIILAKEQEDLRLTDKSQR